MRIYPWPVILIVPLVLGSMIVIGHERGATQEAGRHPVASLTPPSEPSSAQGNPLWGIPLSSLTATRNRPIFTPRLGGRRLTEVRTSLGRRPRPLDRRSFGWGNCR